ncbi:MAG: flavin monoamine oxidase family protein [Beijerinckiaceae bacterium]
MFDGVIVGAGPAGIAAARIWRDAGLSFTVLEARGRAGGRAFTGEVMGARIDLGAHWFELPQQRAARRIMSGLSAGLRRTTGGVRLHGLASRGEDNAFWKHWGRIEEALYDFDDYGMDESVAARLGRYWQAQGQQGRDTAWRSTLDFHLALECGTALDAMSCRDYFHHEETEYSFIEGGYGALIAKAAAGLPVQVNQAVTAIADHGDRVIVTAGDQQIAARFCIVAVPAPVLASGAIDFSGALPPIMTAAFGAFGRAAYERVIVHWPHSPLHRDGRDCLHIFKGDAVLNTEILACIDGSDFHYCELGGNAAGAAFWSHDGKQEFVMNILREKFGSDAASATPVFVSDWGNDPFSLCSWTVCPPGHHGARGIVRDFQNPRLQFAGEFASLSHWGTVTGAWLEGVRVAEKCLTQNDLAHRIASA